MTETRRARVAQVVSEVCIRHQITGVQIMSVRKDRPVAYARMEAMYRVREALGFSTTHIGNLFGKDHTTVIWAITSVRKHLSRGEQWPVINKLTPGYFDPGHIPFGGSEEIPAKPGRPKGSRNTKPPALARPISILDMHMAKHRAAHINAYWREEGIEANARAEIEGGYIVIKSDLQLVRHA